jgi:PBP1b-binding outer membrane lipoprotein LpoB
MRRCFLALMLAGFMSTGCATSRTGGDVVAKTDYRTISAAEWQDFAASMVASMMQTGVLGDFAKDGKVIVAVDSWDNQTDNIEFSQQKNIMLDSMRSALVNTGKVRISETVRATGSGQRQTELSGQMSDLSKSEEFGKDGGVKPGQRNLPQLSLAMSINQTTERSGRTTTKTYVVACKLIDLKMSESVWEDVKPWPKQFERGIFGG